MKLIKYIINLIILTGSIYFLLELSKINELETGEKMTVKIPFISGEASTPYELEVWLAVLAVLTVGVLLGFFVLILSDFSCLVWAFRVHICILLALGGIGHQVLVDWRPRIAEHGGVAKVFPDVVACVKASDKRLEERVGRTHSSWRLRGKSFLSRLSFSSSR